MAKSKKFVLAILSLALVLSLGFLSFTTAKYVLEIGNSGSNMGDDGDIPYALQNKIEVTSQEDLFSALENGYPYIVLSDEVRDPLIVTQETMDVKKSLVIDLNGKRLERVGSNAMLNVPEGLTLTIIDSNKTATGGLYNPVGTVLQVSGGSLSVRGGKYESGPRTWEYVSYTANNRISTGEIQNVQYYVKGSATKETRIMPIINPTIEKEIDGTIKSVDGNVYFDVAYKDIPADTYCYYVTSDNFTSGMTVGLDNSTADFSYTYYAKPGTYEYLSAEEPTDEHVQVMVYGYTKDIQKAMGRGDYTETVTPATGVDPDNAPWYAAVKMEDGTLSVECEGSSVALNSANYLNEHDYQTFSKGSFISYFGVETTACVQFTGGKMTVSTDGVFATVNPKTVNSINPNALSAEGRGICVHNNGTGTGNGGTLTINKGNLLTYNMSAVRLMDGTCFVKKSMCYRVQDTQYYKKQEGYITGTGTIYSAGGDVEVFDTQFWVSSLEEFDGEEEQTGNIDSKGAYGIYSAGGKISTTNSVIHIDGDCCRGIYSNPLSNIDPTVSKDSSGGSVSLYNTLVYVAGNRTFGIYSKGGTITIDADDPKTENGVLVYNSRFFLSGRKIMGIFANLPHGDGRAVHSVEMNNTRIRVNTSEGATNENGDFNVAINSINASLLFTNISVESGAYGITASEGDLTFKDCTLNTKSAPAIILKNGKITARGAIDIDCYIKKEYVDSVPNIWRASSPEHNYLRTYAGIDIQNGTLNVLKENDLGRDQTLTGNEFDYFFDTDVVTRQTKDRIGDNLGNDIPYVNNGGTRSYVFETNGQMKATSAMLPAAMSAVRVMGTRGENALTITSNCKITAKVGGGILVRDGNVNLGDETEQNITVETQGTEYYSDIYHFMGKKYWDYRDTKTGGNAMFVSGGNVVSKATKLTLKSALGNGLFVTGASIRPDVNMNYKGEITFADGSPDNPVPTVTIDAGTFIGDATDTFINDRSWEFYFTGPSSFYGVKVVCGGKVEINGGTFGGYGAVCTMGAITNTAVKAHLTITGDYRYASKRITMSGKRDVACFYNASDVTINSIDNPYAKIYSSDKYDYDNAADFGVAIPYGANTAIVIESNGPAFGSMVNINGGYYRAVKGDERGAKAIWCANTNAELNINGGYYIGNNGGSGDGGAIQQNQTLAALNLNGGYFFNYSGGSVLTMSTKCNLGTGKNFYLLDASSGYFTKTDSISDKTHSTVCVA